MNRFFKQISAKFEKFLILLHKRRVGLIIGVEIFAVFFLLFGLLSSHKSNSVSTSLFSGNFFSAFQQKEDTEKKEFIKWVDFTVTAEAMTQAFRYDVATCQDEIHLNWVDLLAYLGTKYGGDFTKYTSADMDNLAAKLKEGTSMEELTKDSKYYSYYKEAYGAVLNGMVGYFEIEIPAADAPSFALSDTQINEGNPGESKTDAVTGGTEKV